MPWPLLGCAFTLRSTGHRMHGLLALALYRASVLIAQLASQSSCRLLESAIFPEVKCFVPEKTTHLSPNPPANDRVSRQLARSCRKPATIPRQTSAKPWGLEYPCAGTAPVQKGNTTQRLAAMQVCFSTNSVLRQVRMLFLAHFIKAAGRAFTVAAVHIQGVDLKT